MMNVNYKFVIINIIQQRYDRALYGLFDNRSAHLRPITLFIIYFMFIIIRQYLHFHIRPTITLLEPKM